MKVKVCVPDGLFDGSPVGAPGAGGSGGSGPVIVTASLAVSPLVLPPANAAGFLEYSSATCPAADRVRLCGRKLASTESGSVVGVHLLVADPGAWADIGFELRVNGLVASGFPAEIRDELGIGYFPCALALPLAAQVELFAHNWGAVDWVVAGALRGFEWVTV